MRIRRGTTEYDVTESAFKEYFEPFGWCRIGQDKAKKSSNMNNQDEDEIDLGGNMEDPLLMKPASEMTGKELKKYAKLVGITGQFDTKEELMQAVIEHQKKG